MDTSFSFLTDKLFNFDNSKVPVNGLNKINAFSLNIIKIAFATTAIIVSTFQYDVQHAKYQT